MITCWFIRMQYVKVRRKLVLEDIVFLKAICYNLFIGFLCIVEDIYEAKEATKRAYAQGQFHVSFLNFVKADLSESETDFEDDFVEKLQNTIRRIKSNREMEERFMIFEEMLRDERAEGKAEAVLEMLLELMDDLGEIPDELRNRITSEKDLETLKKWLRLAARSESLDEFLEKM